MAPSTRVLSARTRLGLARGSRDFACDARAKLHYFRCGITASWVRSFMMAWKTPKIVEVALGAEINCYACAELTA